MPSTSPQRGSADKPSNTAASVSASPPAKPESSPLRRALKDILAGTAGGIGLVVVGHPFDTLKVRASSQHTSPNALPRCGLIPCCLFLSLQVRLQTQSSSAPRYSGLLDCVRQTFAAEGLLGFYRGVSSPLAGQIVFNAAQFLAYSPSQGLSGGGRQGGGGGAERG